MLTYIVRRLLQLFIVLFGVSIITFVMLYVIPGDPARMLAGKNATEEKIQEIRVQKGLDKPIYIQYGKWLGGVLQGDLGESYYLQQSVGSMIVENAPNTIQLALAAVLIELLGVPLGIYSALRQYSFWDTTLTTAASSSGASPSSSSACSCSGSSASSSISGSGSTSSRSRAPATTSSGSSRRRGRAS